MGVRVIDRVASTRFVDRMTKATIWGSVSSTSTFMRTPTTTGAVLTGAAAGGLAFGVWGTAAGSGLPPGLTGGGSNCRGVGLGGLGAGGGASSGGEAGSPFAA